MPKVFITGIEGFAGYHLVQELAAHGYNICGLHRADVPVSHLPGEITELFPCDILDKENVFRALKACAPDFIIHLAAISFVMDGQSAPAKTFEVNLLGTLNVLEYVRTCAPKTRTLIVSSSEVYGAPKHTGDLPFTEQSPYNPQNIYAASKTSCDLAAQQYAAQWKLPIVIARPFNHIGARQSENFVTAAFAKQIAQIACGLRANTIEVGNLAAARDFSDVRDVMRAYRMLLESSETGVFNICSGKPEKISDILQKLIDYSRVEVNISIDPNRFRTVDVPVIYGSFEKIRAHCAWAPEHDIDTAIKTVFDYWFGVINDAKKNN